MTARPLSVSPSVALCVLTCTCASRRPNALPRLLLPSVVEHTGKKALSTLALYVGLDFDDRLHNDTQWKHQVRGLLPHGTYVSFVPVYPHERRRSLPWNELVRVAYRDGHDYFVRTNDDVVVLTFGWLPKLIGALQAMHNLGVVGPSFAEGNTQILAAMDVTHRTHLCIFSGSYYPNVFENYYVDDWISKVYGANHTRKLRTVRASHRLSYHGQQYRAAGDQDRLVADEVATGRTTIASRKGACMVTRPNPTPWSPRGGCARRRHQLQHD
jgi:hypothetical protein